MVGKCEGGLPLRVWNAESAGSIEGQAPHGFAPLHVTPPPPPQPGNYLAARLCLAMKPLRNGMAGFPDKKVKSALLLKLQRRGCKAVSPHRCDSRVLRREQVNLQYGAESINTSELNTSFHTAV